MAIYHGSIDHGPKYNGEMSGIDPKTGLPRFARGSVEFDEAYRAAIDLGLSEADRREAEQAEIARAESEMDAAGAETLQTRVAPSGFAVVTHSADKTAGVSDSRPLGDGFHLVRHARAEALQSHGFVITELPEAAG